MTNIINPESFLNYRDKGILLVDVRTPLEFSESHIPGAINIPLFSNLERADVGTIFKQKNKEAALLQALDYAGPNLSSYLKILNKATRNMEVLLYCWRGGMRSKSMGWLFNLAGYNTFILEGGYRAYKHHLRDILNLEAKLIILGGMTGSGKSEILNDFELSDHQVVDLEGLANHKGSAFGALGQDDQPSNKHFENLIGEKWRSLDLSKPVWLEDESSSIGKVSIPRSVFLKMRTSNLINIEREKQNRINRLVFEYSLFSENELKDSIMKIAKRLGGKDTTLCVEAVDDENYELVVELTLNYYDKAYSRGILKRDQTTVFTVLVSNDNSANQVIDFAKKHKLI